MFPIDDPELAVENAVCKAAKVHLSHMNSYRQEEKETRVKVKLVQRVGGLQDFVEEKANLFVLRSLNRWSLF